MTLRISVVVPTYRRPDLLERCLTELTSQDLDRDSFEIVVADDGPGEKTRGVVDRFSRDGVRYVPVEDQHGPAAARNRAWQAARGEIIAFTDDDTLAAPDWLRRGSEAFRDGVAGVAGRIVVPLPKRPTDFERNMAGLERGEFVTANCFYRRDALEAVGGFDERFTAPWREDADLFFTLLERGYRLEWAPEAVVVHPLRPGSWGVSLRQQAQNAYDALLYKKHPDLYRKRIPRAGWRYYVIAASAAVAVGATFLGTPHLAVIAAASWGLMTSRFLMQRLSGTSHAPTHVADMLVTSILIPPLAIFWRLRGALRYRVAFL